MKYGIRETTRFKKSLKTMIKRGKDKRKLLEVIRTLAAGETLPDKYRDHALIGDWVGYRDCHIENDWVLIYKIRDDILVLALADTGTHSDLSL